MAERHHFVPRFYLENFIDKDSPPYLWVYDKEGGDIFSASSRDAGLRKHFYSYPRKDGTKDSDSFEEGVSKIESEAAPVFKRILQRQALNSDERSMVSFFLAFMMTRVPTFRDNIHRHAAEVVKVTGRRLASQEEWFARYLKDLKAAGKEVSTEQARLVTDLIREGRFDVEIMPHYSLLFIAKLAIEVAPIICQMNWAYIVPKDSYRFVTSDNPLAYVDPGHDPKSALGVGLSNPNVEVTFPVSPEMALFAGWKDVGKPFQKGSNPRVKEINYRTISNAQRFVYASYRDHGLDKLVKKHRATEPMIKIKTIEVHDGHLIASTFNPQQSKRTTLVERTKGTKARY